MQRREWKGILRKKEESKKTRQNKTRQHEKRWTSKKREKSYLIFVVLYILTVDSSLNVTESYCSECGSGSQSVRTTRGSKEVAHRVLHICSNHPGSLGNVSASLFIQWLGCVMNSFIQLPGKMCRSSSRR